MAKSWDFWDTLVTRCVLEPSEVFALVERISGVVGFTAARIAAERRSRAGVPETTLDRIYASLPYDEATRQELRKVELNVEEHVASPVATNVAKWSANDVVVSDMYLDRQTMLRIATACGLDLPAAGLFLSSELGATKHTGALFDHVAKQVPLSCHVGDNRHSDVFMPTSKGIRATHFKEPAATQIEREWFSANSKDSRLIAGLLRATRLAEPPAAGYVKGEWVVYSQLVAPLLLHFVDWTLRQCEQRGIEQLFFLARDGQVLHRIACALLAARRSKIQVHYAYASRQALHLPGHMSMAQSESWIADNTALLSLRVIAERIGVDAGRVATIASRHVTAGIDDNLSTTQRAYLPALMRDPEFADLVSASAERALGAAAAYFRQIGLLNPVHARVGIVDVGWVGRVQRSLEGISSKAGLSPDRITGFYLGLAASSVHASGERLVGMLADPFRTDSAADDDWVDSHRGMFEFFLRANHATTQGYRTEIGSLAAPILGAPLSVDERRDIERKQFAIMAFVERYCRIEALVGATLAEELQPSRSAIRRLLERPTQKEAAVFVAQCHTEQQVERDFTPLVRSIGMTDALLRRSVQRFGIWAEGSCALSRVLWLFRLRRLAGKVRKSLRGSAAKQKQQRLI